MSHQPDGRCPVPGSSVGQAGDLGDCFRVRLRVPVRDIDYFCRLLEAHEDLAIARTENGTSDILEFWIPRGMLPDAMEFLESQIGLGLGELLSGPEVMPAGWPASDIWAPGREEIK